MKKIKVMAILLVCATLLFTIVSVLGSAEETNLPDFKPETANDKIYGIPASSTVKVLKSAYDRTIIDVTTADGKKVASGSTETIGTGYKVKINGHAYTAVVMGDVDGSGSISAVDYALVKRTYLGTAGEAALTGIYLEAAGVKAGNRLTARNYVLLKRAYFGTYNMNAEYTVEPYDPKVDDDSGWTDSWV